MFSASKNDYGFYLELRKNLISLNHFNPLLILWYRHTIYSVTKLGHQLTYIQSSEMLTKLYQK